jgi:hypothetical protein
MRSLRVISTRWNHVMRIIHKSWVSWASFWDSTLDISSKVPESHAGRDMSWMYSGLGLFYVTVFYMLPHDGGNVSFHDVNFRARC